MKYCYFRDEMCELGVSDDVGRFQHGVDAIDETMRRLSDPLLPRLRTDVHRHVIHIGMKLARKETSKTQLKVYRRC